MPVLKSLKNILILNNLYNRINPFTGLILMLHRVVETRSELDDNRKLEITPDFLEQTIRHYQEAGYQFVSIDEAYHIQKQREKPDKPYLCFTFDDGFRDNLTMAFPIFEKYHIPFTIYIATDFPDGKAFIWWYWLEKLLMSSNKLILTDGTEYHCETTAAKNQTFNQIKQRIRDNGQYNTKAFLEKLFGKSLLNQPLPLSSAPVLSWDDIRQLQASGLCTIGSHGISHTSFTQMDDETLKNELQLSRERIEAQIGKKVQHLAYPYGDMNPHVAKSVKQCGYLSAVCIDGGMQRIHQNPFYFKRSSLCQL